MIPITSSAVSPPSRKVFNTFIDDGALISGIKRSNRDGIKKMVRDGSINLFVPLHTLDRLRRLGKGRDRRSRDATEALRWLDDITSKSDRVHLQGGFEFYEKWEDVEQYMLPQTLLSMETESLNADSVGDDLANLQLDSWDKASLSSSESLDHPSIKSSPVSNYSEPGPQPKDKLLAPIGTGRPSHRKTSSEVSGASVTSIKRATSDRLPYSLRPFFNHIIWRIHHEQNADVSMESFILITHDDLKQRIAKRFGMRAKTLEQLRKILERETREYNTRPALMQGEVPLPQSASPAQHNGIGVTPSIAVNENGTFKGSIDDEAANSDEEEVIFKREPPKAPQAMATERILDPNHFGRSSPVYDGGGFRGNLFARSTNPGTRGGRGSRGPGFRGRAGLRGGLHPAMISKNAPHPQSAIDFDTPIDPDSFARPMPNGRNRGRGAQRRLWEPS